ncbi:MAG: glycosyltransferase family 2 protein [Patescibacteria group bacterium]|jgi:GT2 family glycosyltransferase
MISPKVTIIIVTRNSQRFMASCLDSIYAQTYRDFQVLVIDNDSHDGTVEFVRSNYPQTVMFVNNKNSGFAKANNQGIRLIKSPFFLLCNPDIILEPDWLEKIMSIAELEQNNDCASFGGKLLKLKLINAEIGETEKTEIIDSCGLKFLKNHRFVEWGAGDPAAEYNQAQEVFGHSGALVLLRKESLEQVVIQDRHHYTGDFLDSNFFFYKEDVDLAWRLRLQGFRSMFIPEAVAYHLRTFPAAQNNRLGEVVANRRQQNDLARYYSYRNHFLVLLGNEYLSNLIIYSPFIAWYELKKFCYLLIFEIRNLKAIAEVIGMLPQTLAKRRQIFRRAKLKAGDIRKWIS